MIDKAHLEETLRKKGLPCDRVTVHLCQEIMTLVDVLLDQGIVTRIETRPRQPLAMGNYDLVVTFSQGHQIYRKEI